MSFSEFYERKFLVLLSALVTSRYNLPNMLIKDLGEFGTIEVINQLISSSRSKEMDSVQHLVIDSGDDSAGWSPHGTTELITTDTVVEDIHFTSESISWHDLGWKVLASNISDIASMGAYPSYAVVTLGLPPETEINDITELYTGMLSIANKYQVSIIGGDMVRSTQIFISITLTGTTSKEPLLRSTANAGDVIAVTGYLGGSAGGLRLIQQSVNVSQASQDYLLTAHRMPTPQVESGRVLVDCDIRTAMDISDGLADDLSKLCLASEVSATIYLNKVPTHSLVKSSFPETYIELALYGGEDYELLFTGNITAVNEAIQLLPEGACIIGEITDSTPGVISLVGEDGSERVATRQGWDHFT